MSETKFTKGPLEIKGPSLGGTSDDDGGDYAILDAKGCIIGEAICVVETDGTRPARENALLWKVAPEMYEALEDIASLEAPFKRDPLEFAKSVIAKHESVANAALAKARGEEAP